MRISSGLRDPTCSSSWLASSCETRHQCFKCRISVWCFLRLPAEICTDTSSMPLDYGFVQQLKNQMNHLKPLSTSTHGFSKVLCTLNWMTVLMCSSVLTKFPHHCLSLTQGHTKFYQGMTNT
ncbi:hypothetical protein TNCV_4411421 [Trichonephila clavipes]|nr:hypothetical protein TNCV_4411421 [Trichonephila clavipes]